MQVYNILWSIMSNICCTGRGQYVFLFFSIPTAENIKGSICLPDKAGAALSPSRLYYNRVYSNHMRSSSSLVCVFLV
jgi:hypothetical protein